MGIEVDEYSVGKLMVNFLPFDCSDVGWIITNVWECEDLCVMHIVIKSFSDGVHVCIDQWSIKTARMTLPTPPFIK